MTTKGLNAAAVLAAYRESQEELERLGQLVRNGQAVAAAQGRGLLERLEKLEGERAAWAEERARLLRNQRMMGEALIRAFAARSAMLEVVGRQALEQLQRQRLTIEPAGVELRFDMEDLERALKEIQLAKEHG